MNKYKSLIMLFLLASCGNEETPTDSPQENQGATELTEEEKTQLNFIIDGIEYSSDN